MSFKSSNCFKIVSDHLRLSLNATNEVFLCRICVKYHYTIRVVCAYALRKRPRCALIGACALIRTNTIVVLVSSLTVEMFC